MFQQLSNFTNSNKRRKENNNNNNNNNNNSDRNGFLKKSKYNFQDRKDYK